MTPRLPNPLHLLLMLALTPLAGCDEDPISDACDTSAGCQPPVAELEASVSGLPDTVRNGTLYPAVITVRNLSADAASDGARVGLCLFNAFAAGQSCNAEYPGFNVLDVPAIAPLDSAVLPIFLDVPKDALLFVDRVRDFQEQIVACLLEADAPDEAINDATSRACGTGQDAWVVADLEAACGPPLLALPDTLTAADAGASCAHHESTFVIGALDATAGQGLTITRDAGAGTVRILDAGLEWLDPTGLDGPTFTFEIPADGRYFVVLGNPATAVTVEATLN